MTRYTIGMMSGTSLDGLDAVLTDCSHPNQCRVLAHVECSIPEQLKKTLYQLNYPSDNCQGGELHIATVAEHELTECYAKAYQQLIEISGVNPNEVAAIGAHGQTIRHEPNAEIPYTTQLLNGALLSHLTKQTVVCDFRSKDLAAGGQGAPLAPIFHQQLFNAEPPFSVVNIGGISNISIIGQNNVISGYDCGPGNCLLDEWIGKELGKSFDKDGAWAAQGQVLPELLSQWLSDDYFVAKAPKSTGRDYFNLSWLSRYLDGDESAVDVMRTLTQLTAVAIADELTGIPRVILAGGGARNRLLIEAIKQLLPDAGVTLADAWGVDMQHVEALGFALLANHTVNYQKTDTCSITGASQPIILGAIYPH